MNVHINRRMPLRVLYWMALAFTSTAATTHAAVIYDNGMGFSTTGVLSDFGPNRLGIPNQMASQFILPVDAMITGLVWTGFHVALDPPAEAFTIQIYAAGSNGLPEANPLHSLAIGNDVDHIVKDGRPGYSASIAPLVLTAGTAYWLSIFNTSGPGVDDDWFWFFGGGFATAASRSGPTAGWGARPNRLDFQILGEPCPSRPRCCCSAAASPVCGSPAGGGPRIVG